MRRGPSNLWDTGYLECKTSCEKQEFDIYHFKIGSKTTKACLNNLWDKLILARLELVTTKIWQKRVDKILYSLVICNRLTSRETFGPCSSANSDGAQYSSPSTLFYGKEQPKLVQELSFMTWSLYKTGHWTCPNLFKNSVSILDLLHLIWKQSRNQEELPTNHHFNICEYDDRLNLLIR